MKLLFIISRFRLIFQFQPEVLIVLVKLLLEDNTIEIGKNLAIVLICVIIAVLIICVVFKEHIVNLTTALFNSTAKNTPKNKRKNNKYRKKKKRRQKKRRK